MHACHCFLVQHCLAGWETAKPSIVPPQSSIDLKSALTTKTGRTGTMVMIEYMHQYDIIHVVMMVADC